MEQRTDGLHCLHLEPLPNQESVELGQVDYGSPRPVGFGTDEQQAVKPRTCGGVDLFYSLL